MNGMKYVLAVVGLLAACSAGDRSAPEATGALTLPLVATDSQGEVYRLRNAAFFIYGYPRDSFPVSGGGGEGGAGSGSYYYSETVSTEGLPDQPEITRRLLPGSYYVSFQTSVNWYIEHETENGPVRVTNAILLSNTTQYAYVYDRGSTSVFYQFGVDGRPVDFRHGDLSIQIGIEHPDEGAAGSAGSGGAAF